MNINKFDIFNVDFPQNSGHHTQVGKRPAVIISNQVSNNVAPTVTVIPLSSQLKKLDQPTHTVILKTTANRLKNDSLLLAEQVATLDKRSVLFKIGSITDPEVQKEIFKCFVATFTGTKDLSAIAAAY